MARRDKNAYHDFYIGGVLQARLNTRPRAEGYPRTEIKRIANWHSRPDTDEVAPDTPSGRRGEIPYPRTTRGKNLTYELQQQALSEDTLNTSIAALRAAFSDASSIGFLIATPWPGHADDIWATFCRAEDFDGDADLIYDAHHVPAPWMLDPTLVLRQSDGRWLWWNESGTPGTAMSFSGSTNVSVTNSGDAPADPHIEVTGVTAGQDLHVGRDLAGGGTVGLWFRAIPSSGTVAIDFPGRSVSVGGVPLDDKHYDAANSQWWDEYVEGVPPGVHNLWHGPGAGTGISVSFWSCGW